MDKRRTHTSGDSEPTVPASLRAAHVSALRQLNASGGDAWLSLVGAAAAAASAVSAAMIFVARSIREDRLRDWLAERQ